MRIRSFTKWGAVILLALGSWTANAKDVIPMLGSVLTEGYDLKKDIGPKGSIAFDAAKGQFTGTYTALKMPPGRRAIFAWVHDTTNQKSEYIGPVGWLKNGTGFQKKGKFAIKVPAKYRNGNFGTNEIIAFTAEKTGYLDQNGRVLTQPSEPSGSAAQAAHKPAFYLYAALPGADTDLHYCGHGKDFFYAKSPDKQVCYD